MHAMIGGQLVDFLGVLKFNQVVLQASDRSSIATARLRGGAGTTITKRNPIAQLTKSERGRSVDYDSLAPVPVLASESVASEPDLDSSLRISASIPFGGSVSTSMRILL
jgi:hypothetical protein